MYDDKNLTIIAGDDFTIGVNFMYDGETAVFEDGDTAEMLIHAENDEIIIKANKVSDNTAFFYLSSETTQSLLRDYETESCYDYCIRVNWANRGRHTPIHRKMLTVKRC